MDINPSQPSVSQIVRGLGDKYETMAANPAQGMKIGVRGLLQELFHIFTITK